MLNHCTPTSWTNDLTPPQGDWDYETNPNAKFEWSDLGSSLADLFSVIGKGFVQAHKPIADLINQAGYHISPIIDEIADYSMRLEKLDEDELVKNGRHIVKSQKPGVELPARMTNSGPPERRKRK